MANTINFANASQTIEYISATNAQVSGMTIAEAESALGAQAASNGMRLVGFETQAGADAVMEFNAGNAADAYASYINSGGLAAESTAATTATGVNAGTVALAEVGGQSAVVGVAAGSAGVIAAAAAPIFGVALGGLLYESNPDFWTRLSQKLIPWEWDESDILPIVYDEQGNTYIPQNAITAVEEFLTAEGIGAESITEEIISPSLSTVKYLTKVRVGDPSFDRWPLPIQSISGGDLYFTQWGIEGQTYSFYVAFSPNVTYSKNNASADRYRRLPTDSFVYNNVTYYRNSLGQSLGASPSSYYPLGGAESEIPSDTILGIILSNYTGAQFPDGSSKWEGNTYPTSPNIIDVYTGTDALGNPQYETYQQVALPVGDPLSSNDPLVQPNPYYNPQPEVDPQIGTEIYPAIDPYVNPIASPVQFPNTIEIPSIAERTAPLPNIKVVPQAATENVPLPETDPSVDTENTPANPNQPLQPINNGNSAFPTLPLIPLFPTSAAGLYHVYNPTNAQLQDFGSWLWTTFSGNLIDTLSKLFNNPMDAVISLQEHYYTPNISSTGTIRCGYLDSEVPSSLVGNRYSTLNCGNIIIPEHWHNYLDYTPYTQVIVYLPFVGFMTLNADDIIGNAVNITYHIDSYTGSVIAIISVAREGYYSVVYQFEGNCSVDVPVTGGQQSSIKGAIIGGISGAVAGGVAGAAVGAVVGGLSTKNDVQHSGSFSASYGAMGSKKPFIVVRRPVQKVVMNYNESYGYPAHKMVYVGNCRGYLRAKEVRVLSTTATNEEKSLIVNALKSGVYVRN